MKVFSALIKGQAKEKSGDIVDHSTAMTNK